jgi:hypothetical protein
MLRTATFLAIVIGGLLLGICWLRIIEPFCTLEDQPLSLRPDWQEQVGKAYLQKAQPSTHHQYAAHVGPSVIQQIQVIQENPKGKNTENQKPWYGAGWWKKFFCEMKAGDAAVAYFTFCLVVVGAFQAWGQSKETRILQRAYLSVEPGGIAPYASPDTLDDPDYRLVGHIRIRNAGHLPARKVTYHFNTAFSTDPNWTEERLSRIDERGTEGEAEGAVGPVGNNVIPPGSTMNQGGPTRLLGEKGWVYVWGIVTYNDGFVDGRIIRFCHRYNLKRFQPGKDGKRRIKPKYGRHYERGQDAT